MQKILWTYLWQLHLCFLGNQGGIICSADFAVVFNTKKELFTWPVHKTQYKQKTHSESRPAWLDRDLKNSVLMTQILLKFLESKARISSGHFPPFPKAENTVDTKH